MKICFTSDLHGDESLYTQLLQVVKRERPSVLLLGGDQCPIGLGPSAADVQREWFRNQFRRFLESARPDCEVYWASGNHDLMASHDALADLQQQRLIARCDMQWQVIGQGWSVVSFPFVPVSRWFYKDWERRDEAQLVRVEAPENSFISRDGKIEQTPTARFVMAQPTLRSLLQEIDRPPEVASALLLAHCPPYASRLDRGAVGKWLGSQALSDFLQSVDVFELACCGHVHEAPYLTRRWVQAVGRTLCINPGQWGEALHAVLFETEDVRGTLTHTVFGRLGQSKVPRRWAWSMRRELQKRWRSADPGTN